MKKKKDPHALRFSLVKEKENAAVFHDPCHVYWHWKRCFRQLVLQRMQAICKEFYGQ